MRRHHALFALLAGGLLAAGCSLGGGDIAADGEWKEFSVDGEFSAELPGNPDDADLGGQAGRLYSVKEGDLEVGIAVTDLPSAGDLTAELIEGLLTQINEAAATAMGGTLVSNEPVSGLGYAAQDAEFTALHNDAELVGLTRAAVVGERQFQLMAIGADGERDDVEAIFDRLIESFEPVSGGGPTGR